MSAKVLPFRRPGATYHGPGQRDLFVGDTGPVGAPSWLPPADYPTWPSGPVAVDLETRDPYLKTHGPGWCLPEADAGNVIGIAVAWQGFQGYWPFGHVHGNLPREHVLSWVRDQLARPDVEPVFHNGGYDRGWLQREGIPLSRRTHDTLVQATLLDENRRSYSLDNLAKDLLGRSKDTRWLVEWAKGWGLGDPMSNLWALPAAAVGPYAETDAALTFALHQQLHPALAGEDLTQVYALELDLQPVLLAMRTRGVRVDVGAAERLRTEALRHEGDAGEILQSLNDGKLVEVWSGDSIARAYTRAGFTDFERTATGDPSFTKEWLGGRAAGGDPFATALLEARKWNKVRTMFIEGHILAHVRANGRVYPQLHPLRSDDGGGVTGRFSCTDPNLQQLSARDKVLAPLVRGLFLPEEGCDWAACDYSQQEPRMLVHFASLINAPGAADAVHRYRTDPTTDFHQLVVDLTGQPRSKAKVLNLAQFYGQGGAALCRDLGLPTQWVPSYSGDRMIEVAGPEGQAIINQYREQVPFVTAISLRCKELAERRGYIRTLAGRRRRFEPKHRGGAYAHKALNALVQGSSADQTKYAMIALHRAGWTPLVSVHDEVAVPLPVGDTACEAVVKQLMTDCVQLEVPSMVDLARGPTWGQALDG